VEGYFCEYRKTRDFSAKSPEPVGFDLVDSGRVDLDPLDLDLTAVATSGVVVRSGALDLDLTAGDGCKRWAAVLSRRRRWAAALPTLGQIELGGSICLWVFT
jgi:hypothetical protein